MNSRIKPMSIDEMILALDRISRFKFPSEKLTRVYVETICAHNVIFKSKKDDINNLSNKELKNIFTQIWNMSVTSNFGSLSFDYNLNLNYINEENKCYNITSDELNLMPSNADFKTLTDNIDKNKIPNNFLNYKTPRKLVLTEGATEEILLPKFSKIHGYDWDKNFVKILSIGGKSRISKIYNTYKQKLKIPVFILLDADAVSEGKLLSNNMRDVDCLHIIKNGEIEDIIPVSLFKNAINSQYKLQAKVSVNDFDKNLPMVKNLHNIYKKFGFGDFKKAKTAMLIKQYPNKNIKLSEELIAILTEIQEM